MKPIIGIEKSQTQVKLVEVEVSAKPPKLLNFALVGLPSANELEAVKYVKEVSASYKFKGREAAIAESGDVVQHKLIELPPMSRKNLRQVINREARSSASAQEPAGGLDSLAIGYKVIGKKAVLGTERNEILIISAPQEVARGLVSFVDAVGWKAKVVTATPIVLLSLARLHPSYNPQAIAAFILLDEYSGHLAIGMDDKLLFSRSLGEFPLENVEERVEKVAIEINRSVLWFGQRHRDAGRLEQVFVCGNRDILPAINVALGNVLERPIEIFDLSLLLDLSPLGERSREFETLAASFAIPIGAALELNRALPLNLLPKEVKEKRLQFQLKTKLVISSALAATFLAVASTEVYLSTLRSKYVKLSNQNRKKLEELQPPLKALEEVQRERSVHQQQLNFLKGFSPGGEWESMLNAIATIIPSNVSLISLDLSRKGEQWELSHKGQAESESLAIAFSAVNQFYYDLRRLPYFSEVRMEPPKMTNSRSLEALGASGASSSGSSSEIAAKEKVKEKEKIVVSFEIQAALTSKPFKLSELFEGGGRRAEGGIKD